MDERVPIADLPPGFYRKTDPPKALVVALGDDKRKECGGYMEVTWTRGPYKGHVATAYCAEPLCITEGHCTGPRFVPHVKQHTSLDVNDPLRRERPMPTTQKGRDEYMRELVVIAQTCNKDATRKTGVKNRQSEREIARFIGMVWKKTLQAIRADGQWHR